MTVGLDPHTRARIEAAIVKREFLDIVETIAATPAEWFYGLDPATGWALQWIASDEMDTFGALGTAARAGYRHARLLLEVEEHPDYCAPEILDMTAERLLMAASGLAVAENFDELPAGVFLVNHCIAEGLVRAVLTYETDTARERLLCAFHLILDQGFSVGLVESELVSGNRSML